MKQVLVYTMKGCPHCEEVKEILENENIEFLERDIDKYKDEYRLFKEATENEFVPAFFLLETTDNNEYKPTLLAPDRDFNELTEAVQKVKKFLM